MPYLNESAEFKLIASLDVRRAFRGEPEAKELLNKGTKLYKWTQYPLVGSRGITPWWSLVDSLKIKTGSTVPGLQSLRVRAARLGARENDFSRVRSAVTEQWNSMSKPLFIELLEPVWAWIGQASGQLKDMNDPKVVLIGGSYQIWLPSLTIQHVRPIAALPYLKVR